jgi:hypothetical protein
MLGRYDFDAHQAAELVEPGIVAEAGSLIHLDDSPGPSRFKHGIATVNQRSRRDSRGPAVCGRPLRRSF